MVDPNLLAYTYEEAAELLCVTVPFIKWATKNGKLLAIGERRNVVISGTSVRQFIARQHGLPHSVKPQGYIYLVRFMNYHKIGLSIDVQKRLTAINQGLPQPASLIHSIPTTDMVKSESGLHIEYAHCRRRGEWFCLTPGDVERICSIKGFWY